MTGSHHRSNGPAVKRGRTRLATAALLALGALSLLVGAPASYATFPGANGKIVLASNERLFTINADGSRFAPVPTSSCEGLEPDWHPNGRVIGFIERCGPSGSFDLSVVNVNWSRDGASFLFIADVAGNRDVYVKDLRTGLVRNLTNSPATDDWPAWSPDGRRIAFTSDRSGDFEVYAMNADGTGVTNLTNDPADDGDPAMGGPSWSPDGRRIAFDSLRTGALEVFTIDATGTNVVQLTNGGTNWAPAWSPDGRLIAFVSDRTGDRELFLMARDGSRQSQLTVNPGVDERPDWQVLPERGGGAR
jgi:WD40 repeat protein